MMVAAMIAIDARDRRQAGVLLTVGRELGIDALVELRDVLVELFEARELPSGG
jgi:hypothetical protein